MAIILAVNAGSSSVKLTVFDAERGHLKRIAHSSVSGVQSDQAELKYSRNGTGDTKQDKVKEAGKSHQSAFTFMLETLINDQELPQIAKEQDISTICHRIVHGGDFEKPQIINDDVFNRLEELSNLAPLHNGSAMEIVKRCLKMSSECTNMAFFDTQFHQSIPRHVYTYPINQDIAAKHNLRKYGFHGLSYAFITKQVARELRKDESQVNIIALHLGSGASACAIQNGTSRDTSMGLTPLSGLPGATRSGNVDPSLIFHYTSSASRMAGELPNHMHISQAEEILNQQSGWHALTGTKDFGVISQCEEKSHKLAFDIFVERICAFVGHYYVSLRGNVDSLVFAGGIGENSPELRSAVTRELACLGFFIDEGANKLDSEDTVIDITGAKANHCVMVCRVDEEMEMAQHCVNK